MLAKRLRVPIQAFPKNAKPFYRGTFFIAKFAPNNLTYGRVGVVLGKKVIKRATDRNKVRRKIFRIFTEQREVLSGQKEGGRDMVFIITKTPILDREAEERFTNDLKGVVEKIRQLSK